MNETLTILHLSDFHFRSDREFDRSVVLEPLLTRLAKDRKGGIKPGIIIISGDIAFSCKAGEYSYAASFFKELLTVCTLNNDQLFIVPGNHDVGRSEYRLSDCPTYTDMQVLNTEFENECYRSGLFKGLGNYFSFIGTHYPHMKAGNILEK